MLAQSISNATQGILGFIPNGVATIVVLLAFNTWQVCQTKVQDENRNLLYLTEIIRPPKLSSLLKFVQ